MFVLPTRRLTVVQLLPALCSGGVERSTLEVAAALVQAGHRAIVVSAGGPLVAFLLSIGAEHITLDIGRKSLLTLRHIAALRRLFAQLRPDIVHARSRLPAWLTWYALHGLFFSPKPRFVTTVHGLNAPNPYSAVMTYGERVICVSNVVHDYVLRHYRRTDPQRLRTIPRGVDLARFRRRPYPDRSARRWARKYVPCLDDNTRLLLMPGRGTRLKGHGDALLLLAFLRRVFHYNICLWLPGACQPGRESYLAELEAQARELGVTDCVVFTPPTEHIVEAYAASDLVLQLSRKPEAFGRTVLEALAVGRTVLGWNHGGVGELLTQLQPDGAVSPFDTAVLQRRAAMLLMHSPELPPDIPYTLQTMQSATLQVYDELCT
ncbi:glycosyltransferase [Xylella fastidiosa subsp. fastidiosa]|jgi:glycosyltransferase involved in cell wall biosynthesis|uniref:Glycosyl transferase n=3 Tax=Xylella fastidiosa TaxID=2371 RepID=Q87F61_XYLFT|nr:glycosyltransferase [Xylella fastidiosa]ADN63067.1 glycosyl transferase group 1 [Xylella fastidiosa subsp. fastidiosa GB514]KAF0570446.1 glycosyl transferase [Xylella fastidiosa subsp. fastidiosa Mus-1]AAO27976.1 glycosyl transferase [Xylella fastidiosa Temecula1]ACB91525.1 glycosyl transferase group 1 [Xylella fastidiosa M23]EGO82821.1 glycosyltransferase [Xylella fastidiosa EB92.1]